MTTVYIDAGAYPADPRRNMLETCLSLGFDLPYFCWHPALGSVGACRQCAVKQFKDASDVKGRIVMACMTPAADGTRISVADPEARQFRAQIIEWLMTNHPHDCPVCEEGGECHLQDMTTMSGHVYRRYQGPKRTFRNQNLGPFIGHEMNRCITCYRCVRFYRHYAGGTDLDAFAAHNHVYFGRHRDGALESPFSGNLAEVCPTGVFTDKSFARHYVRKWDLRSAPSVCVHCSLGCNTSAGERHGTLRRIVNRYNGAVNRYFLCDRGRFGYGFVNSAKRVRRPLRRPARAEAGGSFEAAAPGEAVTALAQALKGRVVAIGSPRASVEANYVLMHAVGAGRFHSGMAGREDRLVRLVRDVLRATPARVASLADIELSDAVLVLGEDVANTAPRLALTLRQAVRTEAFALAASAHLAAWDDAAVRNLAQDRRSPLFPVTVDATPLDEIAAEPWRAAPDGIGRIGRAILHALDPEAPPEAPEPTAADYAGRVAAALGQATRPTIIAGTGLGEGEPILAAAAIARALAGAGGQAQLMVVLPEVNSMGLALFDGDGLDAAFHAVESGQADTLLVLENDLYRRAPRARVDGVLEAAGTVIVLDHLLTDTAARADWVIPAASFAEGAGTFVSNEGRAQRSAQVFKPGDGIRESWRWLRDAMQAAGTGEAEHWHGLDDVVAACADAAPALAGIAEAAPPAGYRVRGRRLARETFRHSGRTAVDARQGMEEPRPARDPDTPMSFSMEGHYGPGQPPAYLPFQWAPGWNSHQQALPAFQREVGGPLKGGDPGVGLLEGGGPAPADAPPEPVAVPPGQWRVVPVHHVFGSEELSRESPPLAERIPAPYVAIAAADAERLELGEGDAAEIALDGVAWVLPVRVRPGLVAGLVGVPLGLGTLPATIAAPWTVLRKPVPGT